MTPLHIKILLHYYCGIGRYAAGTDHGASCAVMEQTRELEEWSLIETSPSGVPTITERGRAMVTVLCNTPLPQMAWIDQTGRVIHD